MRTRLLLPAILFLFAAACSKHPLDGNWAEVTTTGAKGVQLGFELDGKRVSVHGRPRPDGGHGHPEGTYTFDAATGGVTIEMTKGQLIDENKATTWTGTVAGDALELSGGTDKLRFQRGGSAH